MRKSAIILLALITLLLLALLLTSCSENIIPAATQTPIFKRDTTTIVTDRIITDTMYLGSEYYTVTDTFPCPPGLVRDSIITVTKLVYFKGKKVPITITVHDTIREIQQSPVSVAKILQPGYSWPERLAWLGAVALLIAGWLRPRKNTPNNPPNFA